MSDRRKRMLTVSSRPNGVSCIKEIDFGSVLRPREVNVPEVHRKRFLTSPRSPTSTSIEKWRRRQIAQQSSVPPVQPAAHTQQQQQQQQHEEIYVSAVTALRMSHNPSATSIDIANAVNKTAVGTTTKRRSISTPSTTPVMRPATSPPRNEKNHEVVDVVEPEVEAEVRQPSVASLRAVEEMEKLNETIKMLSEENSHLREGYAGLEKRYEALLCEVEERKVEDVAEVGVGTDPVVEEVDGRYLELVEKNKGLEEKVAVLEENLGGGEGGELMKERLVAVVRKSFEEKEELKKRIFHLERDHHRDQLDHSVALDELHAQVASYKTEISVLKDFRTAMRPTTAPRSDVPSRSTSRTPPADAIGLTPPVRPASLRGLPPVESLL